jgi:integrase
MPRKAEEVTALAVRRLGDGFHAVGGVPGLYLQVDGSARSWVLRVVVLGRRRDMGLGPFPEVSLANARDAAGAARVQARQGIDPIDARRAARSNSAAARESAKTFDECAAAYIAAKGGEWANAKHGDQWRNTISTYASPVIGRMLVADVDTPHVLAILEPLWQTKTETAVRLRGRLERVLDWAAVRGYRPPAPNPARWRSHLDVMLPQPAKVKKAEHHAALPYAQLPRFMARLRGVEGESARALEFAIFTAARSSEVRGATWAEIDLEAKTWTIPGARMKAGKAHRVPLSEPALRILRKQRRQGDLVFTGRNGGQLSDMAMTLVVRRLAVDAVPHGLARATFKTWATEQSTFAREVIEQALAHVLENKTEDAYWRGDLFDKRVRLMHAWGSYCSRPVGSSG